ncbi:DUF3850 domain-containing protein [Bacillus inaquosorum]|uniref:DUF3850 domain-containing protein n=1 Tax=Bacillus inaquosorum TaxID=483913 RepID=UPI002E041E8F|nr:DUF3850 domain-containing protein [Bacillus inaquosorum]MED1194712.1 DUF3850 domain-containing protein [Bacillus inaquosorum]MED1223858.1 DUF3850 domain-containing protein [Bacillus inaquosorum]
MVVHHLKIYPEYYEAVLKDVKKFEIRKNDRFYMVGDTLVLHEWMDEFTGRKLEAQIKYITDYKQRSRYVVLGIERTKG